MRGADPVHFQYDERTDAAHADREVTVCIRRSVRQILPARIGQKAPFSIYLFRDVELVSVDACQVEIIDILLATDHPVITRITGCGLGAHFNDDIR